MDFDNWDAIRTAYHVARLRTVSGAADALGVHHATVIRHIDNLEDRLGVKLFQRHARGYTPTEAGLDLLQVAQTTADQFDQLAGRLAGQGAAMTGELVLTSIDSLSPMLVPVLADFQQENPDITVRMVTDPRLLRLEYGEAHVAVRAGRSPDEPDNVVQALYTMRSALFAHRSYVDRHGIPESDDDFADHAFVGPTDDGHRAVFYRWLFATVGADRVRFRTTEISTAMQAVLHGGGIGFLPLWWAGRQSDLVEIRPPRDEWNSDLWLVTHVDLHRTPKVQAFTAKLKEAAKAWP